MSGRLHALDPDLASALASALAMLAAAAAGLIATAMGRRGPGDRPSDPDGCY